MSVLSSEMVAALTGGVDPKTAVYDYAACASMLDSYPGWLEKKTKEEKLAWVRDEAVRRREIDFNNYLQARLAEHHRDVKEYLKNKEEWEEKWARSAETNGSGWVRPPTDMKAHLAKWFTSPKREDWPWPYKTCEAAFEDVTLHCDLGRYKKGQNIPYVCYNWKEHSLELFETPEKKETVRLPP